MSKLILHGFPASTYVRTSRLACEEKGVPYTIQEFEPGSEAHGALHPFYKMPAMTHGGVHLFESFAITRYVDEAFDGPALQPDSAAGRAVMTQWVSAMIDYIYPTVVRGLIVPRLVFPQRGVPVDEAALKDNLPNIDKQLSVLDGQLGNNEFVAGDKLTIADLFYLPPVTYLPMTPEGGEALTKCANVTRWQNTMAARASFDATQPQLAA